MRKGSSTGNFVINFVIYNSLIISFLISGKAGIPNFFLTILISLLIFIVPGLSWIGLSKEPEKKNFVDIFFFSFFTSTLIMLLGNFLLVLLKIKSHYLSYLVYILIVVNAGIIFGRRQINVISLVFERIKKKHLLFILIFLFLFVFFYFQAAYYIPPLQDNTLTIQGTAYGLINYLKPYILNDDGMIFYDFAHPLLLHFYGANAILLSGHLQELKYYYDYSQIAKRIQKEGPFIGESFVIYTSQEEFVEVRVLNLEGDYLVLDKKVPWIYLHYAYPNYKLPLLKDASLEVKSSSRGSLVIENKLEKKDLITKNLYEQIRLRGLLKDEYKEFYKNPCVLPTRIVNIFFVLATFFLIFIIISRLCLIPSGFVFFLCVLYISLPEVIMRSLGGSYTAASNFFLMSMVYFYLIKDKSKGLSFFCGVSGALSNHKLILFPLTIFIKRFFSRNKALISKNLIFGFFLGILLYWIYGLSVATRVFFADHFLRHFVNRIFHIAQLGNGPYPGFFRYWQIFIANLSWPVFTLGLISLIIILGKKCRQLDIFSFWFFTGAIIFSIVDWKETKHLMLIVIPLVFGIAYFIQLLSERKDNTSKFIMFSILAVLGFIAIRNFHMFIVNNGYQMLEKLSIF